MKSVKLFHIVFILIFVDIPGLFDRDFVHQTRLNAQRKLEVLITTRVENAPTTPLQKEHFDNPRHHNNSEPINNNNNNIQNTYNERQRIAKVLECANTVNKQELTEAFFAPILRETSVEFIIQKVLSAEDNDENNEKMNDQLYMRTP